MKQLIITGTDTGIGKTWVSAVLTLGLNATYWKPIQSGLEDETDTQFVERVTGLPKLQFIPEKYVLRKPRSPHESAKAEGIRIDPDNLFIPKTETPLIIEGAGGLMVPLTDSFLQIDLYEKWKIPCVIVTRTALGTLNHTLLSIEALRRREIPILGIIMNGDPDIENFKSLSMLTDIPILGSIKKYEQQTKENLIHSFNSLNITPITDYLN